MLFRSRFRVEKIVMLRTGLARLPAMVRGWAKQLEDTAQGSRLAIRRPSCASRAFDSGGQATKGAWGMSRRQEAAKGAEDCDKPGVTVKQVMIPGFPNKPCLNP